MVVGGVEDGEMVDGAMALGEMVDQVREQHVAAAACEDNLWCQLQRFSERFFLFCLRRVGWPARHGGGQGARMERCRVTVTDLHRKNWKIRVAGCMHQYLLTAYLYAIVVFARRLYAAVVVFNIMLQTIMHSKPFELVLA